MAHVRILHSMPYRVFLIVAISLVVLLAGVKGFGHGPKGHTEGGITSLQAMKKGLELYDRLVAKGKLSEGWETNLKRIEVSKWTDGKQKEFVVEFLRSEGKPRSVYIFISEKGKYLGSNFTGK